MSDLENKEDIEDIDQEEQIFLPHGKLDASLLSDESAQAVADEKVISFQSFDECNFDPKILEALKKLGWSAPTPVQQMCLPHSLTGRNVAGFAQTGTGKTGVFLTSIAQKIISHLQSISTESETIHPLAVVLAPTRELAIQIEQDGKEIFSNIGINSMAVYGGIDYQKQASQLKAGIHVIIATPGRLKDFTQKKIVDLSKCQMFVCDEVDRMFEMGFIEDVEYFLEKIPENCQKLLFSATTSEHVKELAFEYLDNPMYISVTPEEIAPESIEQYSILCETPQKLQILLGYLNELKPSKAIIFTNTKLTAQWLQYKLQGNQFESDIITGDLPQRKRIRLMSKIKQGKTKILIATDVASRGLHVAGVTHVFNFDIPDDPSNFIHRIGRTARAGAKGVSISLVCDTYGENYGKVQKLLGKACPDSTWCNEEYLKIEDKAGNPFLDNFGVKKPERIGKPVRKDKESLHGKKPRHDDQNKKPRHDDYKKKDRQEHQKRPHQNRDERFNKKKHHKFDKPVHTQTKGEVLTPAVQKVETPKSIFGLIKHIFKLFFGKKK